MKEMSAYEDVVADNIKDEMITEFIQYLEEHESSSFQEMSEFIIAAVDKYCADQPEDIINLIKMWSTGFFSGTIYAKYYKSVKTIVT